MKQVIIRKETTVKICWVDNHPKLKEGAILDFKDLEGKWTVEKIYARDVQKQSINRTWLAGGLDKKQRLV